MPGRDTTDQLTREVLKLRQDLDRLAKRETRASGTSAERYAAGRAYYNLTSPAGGLYTALGGSYYLHNLALATTSGWTGFQVKTTGIYNVSLVMLAETSTNPTPGVNRCAVQPYRASPSGGGYSIGSVGVKRVTAGWERLGTSGDWHCSPTIACDVEASEGDLLLYQSILPSVTMTKLSVDFSTHLVVALNSVGADP